MEMNGFITKHIETTTVRASHARISCFTKYNQIHEICEWEWKSVWARKQVRTKKVDSY